MAVDQLHINLIGICGTQGTGLLDVGGTVVTRGTHTGGTAYTEIGRQGDRDEAVDGDVVLEAELEGVETSIGISHKVVYRKSIPWQRSEV